MKLRIISTIWKICDIVYNKEVLDVGCVGMAQGNTMSEYIQSLAWEYKGIDEKEDIQKYKSKKKYEVITMFEVLEHLENPGRAIKNIKSMLKILYLLNIKPPDVKRFFMSLLFISFLKNYINVNVLIIPNFPFHQCFFLVFFCDLK